MIIYPIQIRHMCNLDGASGHEDGDGLLVVDVKLEKEKTSKEKRDYP